MLFAEALTHESQSLRGDLGSVLSSVRAVAGRNPNYTLSPGTNSQRYLPLIVPKDWYVELRNYTKYVKRGEFGGSAGDNSNVINIMIS